MTLVTLVTAMHVTLLLLLLVVVVVRRADTVAVSSGGPGRRPNIVVVVTDDQDVTMGGTTPLETARRLIADQGAEFRNAFATTPICCPSRTSILTGRYQHNTGG